MILSLDWETRSAVDIKKAGAYRYAEDPSTEIWCGCYAFQDEPVQVWRPGEPCPPRITEHVRRGGMIAGWNVAFERLIWRHVAQPRHGWPAAALEQFEDTAAAGAAMALPRDLARAAKAMGLPEEKDDEGRRLMLQMAKPRAAKKTGDDPAKPWGDGPFRWWGDEERVARLIAYCVKDVEAERALRRVLMPLSPEERAVYLLDQRINDRGIALDLDLVRAMLRIAADAQKALDHKLTLATGYEVSAASKVAQLTEWVRGQGVEIEGLAKSVLADTLEDERLPEHVREALEIRQEAAKTSTKKLQAMLACASSDGRARGLHLYHGAGTGRWSGKLIQCVTGEHEALTPDGWRRIDSLVGPAEIMCWEPGGGMFWGRGEVNRFPAPAEIAEVSGTMIRGRYTLDHRMPNVLRGLEDWSPSRLLGVKRRDGFLVTAPVAQPDCRLTDAQIRVLVSFQADGTWGGGRGPAIWRFKKIRKIVRLRALLAEVRVAFEERRYPSDLDVTQFHVLPENVPGWLTKGFGPWVLGLSARQARLAFEELAEWDGFRHQRNGAVCLMSPEKEQVEWMATIAALAGIQTTLEWYVDRKSPRGRWSLYERQSRTTSLKRTDISLVPNTEPVYCPTIPGGYWLCRFGDRIFITGNTQNLPRGTGTVKAPEAAADDFLRGSAPWIECVYGPVLSGVSDMLRACLVAGEGRRLIAADYSAIEGRVTAWLAGEEWKLEAFRANDRGDGPGIYELTASEILNKPVAAITKAERQANGKVPELALGYQGGVVAFHSMALIYRVDMADAYDPLLATTEARVWERAERRYKECLERGDTGTDVMTERAWVASEVTKVLWRAKHPATVALWKGLEEAAFDAVIRPGQRFGYNGVVYLVARGFLLCRLPSGRVLAYGGPKVQERETPWGDKKAVVTALGVDSVTKQWRRFALYGGLATENCVQALARDILAHGLRNTEAAGYENVLHVHDEAVADVPEGWGSVSEYERLLCDLPAWAAHLPLVASGYEARRYRKD